MIFVHLCLCHDFYCDEFLLKYFHRPLSNHFAIFANKIIFTIIITVFAIITKHISKYFHVTAYTLKSKTNLRLEVAMIAL